jgi:hypothetical protein
MYFVHRRDFLDKPVNAGGLALSRRVASAALGVIIVILIWSCRNAADAIPSATVDAEIADRAGRGGGPLDPIIYPSTWPRSPMIADQRMWKPKLTAGPA